MLFWFYKYFFVFIVYVAVAFPIISHILYISNNGAIFPCTLGILSKNNVQ